MAPWGVAVVLLFGLVSPCMAKEPRTAEEYFRRGLVRYAAGDLDGAIEDFTNAIAVNSNIDAGALKLLRRINSRYDKDGRFDP